MLKRRKMMRLLCAVSAAGLIVALCAQVIFFRTARKPAVPTVVRVVPAPTPGSKDTTAVETPEPERAVARDTSLPPERDVKEEEDPYNINKPYPLGMKYGIPPDRIEDPDIDDFPGPKEIARVYSIGQLQGEELERRVAEARKRKLSDSQVEAVAGALGLLTNGLSAESLQRDIVRAKLDEIKSEWKQVRDRLEDHYARVAEVKKAAKENDEQVKALLNEVSEKGEELHAMLGEYPEVTALRDRLAEIKEVWPGPGLAVPGGLEEQRAEIGVALNALNKRKKLGVSVDEDKIAALKNELESIERRLNELPTDQYLAARKLEELERKTVLDDPACREFADEIAEKHCLAMKRIDSLPEVKRELLEYQLDRRKNYELREQRLWAEEVLKYVDEKQKEMIAATGEAES